MPHEPTAECRAHHCHTHGEDEPVNEHDPYNRICGECFHLFPTVEALQADYLAAMVKLDPAVARSAPNPERIYFCPHCGHDF